MILLLPNLPQMKKTLFTAIALLMLQSATQAKVITLEGTYQGDNIFIYNPFDSSRGVFHVKFILVNSIQVQQYRTTALEIDLSKHELGDYVFIQISVDETDRFAIDLKLDQSQVKVMNPDALRSKSTFEVVYIDVNQEMIKWTTKNEETQEPYVIERFQNNRWIPVGKVIARGSEGYNNYKYRVKHLNTGCTYRIKQRDLSNYAYTDPVLYIPTN
jgi:hypothetical protein